MQMPLFYLQKLMGKKKVTQESEILISHLGYSDACGQLIATWDRGLVNDLVEGFSLKLESAITGSNRTGTIASNMVCVMIITVRENS